MGANCCSNTTGEERNEVRVIKPLQICSAIGKKINCAIKELKNIEHAGVDLIKKITYIQAWWKGVKSRKMNGIYRQVIPIAIIKFIGRQMKPQHPRVSKIEDQLGPVSASWGNSTILEWRKKQIEKSGCTYFGFWNKVKNLKEGYGQQLYPNGSKYDGFWQDNENEGQGRIIYHTGDYYIGEWKNGKVNGKGSFIGIDGIEYHGNWKNGIHHGYGRQYSNLA